MPTQYLFRCMFRVYAGSLYRSSATQSFLFDILFYFELNENNSGGIQPLLLITIEICAYINCQGLVFDIKGSRRYCMLEKFVWWNLLYRIISPRGYVYIHTCACTYFRDRNVRNDRKLSHLVREYSKKPMHEG